MKIKVTTPPPQSDVLLPGRSSSMFPVADKVEAFKGKPALWTKRPQEKRMCVLIRTGICVGVCDCSMYVSIVNW